MSAVSVRYSAGELAALDEMADEKKISRSQFLRRLLRDEAKRRNVMVDDELDIRPTEPMGQRLDRVTALKQEVAALKRELGKLILRSDIK